MDKEKMTEEITGEAVDRKGFIGWIREHKMQLLFTGISVTTILATAIGIKNQEAMTELWKTLKTQIDKGTLYSSKWFEKADLEELEKARRIVELDYNNPNLDLDYRNYCWNLLNRFDNAIGRIKWADKEYGYPVHSSNGYYLTSDD